MEIELNKFAKDVTDTAMRIIREEYENDRSKRGNMVFIVVSNDGKQGQVAGITDNDHFINAIICYAKSITPSDRMDFLQSLIIAVLNSL